MKRFLASAALAISIAGCGYVSSGTWDDDSGNWERVFGEEKPVTVVLVHSRYWRSPHSTTEFEYFLQVENNTEFRAWLFEKNKLVRLEGDAATPSHFGEAPAWFIPKAAKDYDVWTFEYWPQTFRLIIDRETGDMFLCNHVV